MIKGSFFILTGNNFSLTNFPEGYQTWENEESEFQEFGFLETNKANSKTLYQSKSPL
jgi:hypothetical protein